MQNKYHLIDGLEIIIDTNFLGEGGEGGVYSIISPNKFQKSVAKILLPEKRQEIERRYKVDYMIKNPPDETKDENGHSFLIWPEHLLFENKQFVGFLMPKADGVMLEELSSTELGFYPYPRHNEKLDYEWQRFDRSNPESLILRLKLCCNIAKAIHVLHASNHYIIGDLKPQNILVQSNGLVSLLDLDSCQITEKGIVRFESKMNTPEFNPPENAEELKEKSWDLFIAGIIFYKILCGVHPFSGTCKTPYDSFTLPELKIKEGLFPFGQKEKYFEVLTKGHDTFKDLPSLVQQLFIRCFDIGIYNVNARPTTLDWINQLIAKPIIKFFKSDKEIVLDTQQFTLSWESENGRTAELENHGKVDLNGILVFRASKQSHFKIKISNEFGETNEEILLTLFPTPLIESLFVPAPIIHEVTNLQINFPKFPKTDISINNFQNGIQLDRQNIHSASSNFNLTSFEEIELIKDKKQTTWENVISPLISRFSNINKWIFRKNKIS